MDKRFQLISKQTDVVAQAWKLQQDLDEQIRLGLGAMEQVQKVQAWKRRSSLEREKAQRQEAQNLL